MDYLDRAYSNERTLNKMLRFDFLAQCLCNLSYVHYSQPITHTCIATHHSMYVHVHVSCMSITTPHHAYTSLLTPYMYHMDHSHHGRTHTHTHTHTHNSKQYPPPLWWLNASSVAMDEHPEAVGKMQKANKMAAKVARNQLREIAQLLAGTYLHSGSSFACIHRSDSHIITPGFIIACLPWSCATPTGRKGTQSSWTPLPMNWRQRYGSSYMSFPCLPFPEALVVVNYSTCSQGVLVLVTVGGKKGAGHFLLAGKDEDTATLGPKSVA